MASVVRRRRRPSSSSSVSRARFVTVRAIELKLGIHVPLCDDTRETKFRSGSFHGLATRGPNVKSENMQYLP